MSLLNQHPGHIRGTTWGPDHNNVTKFLMNITTTIATTTVGNGELSRFDRPLLNFAATATIIIMLVGIAGNLLTIIALLRCPKVRNVAAAFIISLCVADSVFCILVLPFSASRFIAGTWNHGPVLCRIVPFLRYGNIGVSLLSIAMITINRYIMIAHHSLYSRIYKKVWIACMIAFCWVFSYGMQLPTLLEVWGAFGYDTNLGTCSIMKDSKGMSSKTALFFTGFLIPCVVIICCYARIFWVVHSSESRLRKHSTTQHKVTPAPISTVTNTTGSATGSVNFNMSSVARTASRIKDQRDVKAKRNEWRITKMVLAIFMSFVVCYLPITIVKIADTDVKYPGFHILGYLLLYLSACINPIIYVIMNKQYRQAYKTVLLCRRPRLLSFTPGGSSLGEKSKEQLGYSYNHSRTMVSQVSLADHRGTSTGLPGRISIENSDNVFDENL